jgi:hypothetical protein
MFTGHPTEHKLAVLALLVIAFTRLFGFLTTSTAQREATAAEPLADIAALGFA